MQTGEVSDMYSEIISRCDSNQRKLRLLESVLLPEMSNLNIANGVLGRISSDVIELDTPLDEELSRNLAVTLEQITNLVFTVSQYMDPRLFEELSNKYSSVDESVNRVHSRLNSFSSSYRELVRIRNLIQQVHSEEKSAQFRISNEFGQLQSVATKISGELAYIESEKDRLRLKAESDFHVPPLMDVVDFSPLSDNSAWLKLYKSDI